MSIAEWLPIIMSMLSKAPKVIEEVKQIWALLTQATAPTADEQAAFDAALDAAHKALQAS